MRKVNRNKTKGTWLTFPEDNSIKVKVRPLDILSLSKTPSEVSTNVSEIFEWFNYIVLDWQGFVDEDDNILDCNEKNKKFVYMYDNEIVAYCIEQANVLRSTVVSKEAENLKKSQDGEQAKVVTQETVKAV